nr:hypothetical protein [Bacillaceae bacterium]
MIRSAARDHSNGQKKKASDPNAYRKGRPPSMAATRSKRVEKRRGPRPQSPIKGSENKFNGLAFRNGLTLSPNASQSENKFNRLASGFSHGTPSTKNGRSEGNRN